MGSVVTASFREREEVKLTMNPTLRKQKGEKARQKKIKLSSKFSTLEINKKRTEAHPVVKAPSKPAALASPKFSKTKLR